MKTKPVKTLLAKALCAGLALVPVLSSADDIDIFTGASAGAAINPRILIVLDNTSNWARHNQKWPGGLQQGQSEANAINTVLGSLGSNVNLGLMEYVTGGNANDDGGMVRYHIRPMTAGNKTNFSTQLTTIYNNVTDPDEKKNSGTPYGNLMYDVYNYFAGANSYSPAATIAAKADAAGYTSAFTRFAAPIAAADTCGKNFVIFIGNPAASGPTSDSAANTAALGALGGVTTQLGLPNFTNQAVVSSITNVGVTSACYATKAAAEAIYYPAGIHEFKAQCDAYTEQCSVGSPAAPTVPIACPAGQLSYSVVQTTVHPATTTYPQTVGASVVTTSPTTGAYASAAAVPASDHGSLVCPATSVAGNVTTAYSCSYAIGAAVPDPGAVNTSGPTTSFYASAAAVNPNTDHGALTCPVGYSCSYSTGGAIGSASPVVTVAPSTNLYATAAQVNTATDTGGQACAANDTCSYSVGGVSGATTGLGTAVLTSAQSNASYATSGAATTAMNNASDRGGLTCPAGSACTYSLGAAVTTTSTSSATTSICYKDLQGNGSTFWENSSDTAGLTCPAGHTCSYSGAFGTAANCSGNGNSIMRVLVTQTAVPTTSKYTITQSARPITYNWAITRTSTAKLKYTVTQAATLSGQRFTISQTATPTLTTTVVTPAFNTTATLGMTSQCYASAPSSTTDFAAQCTGNNLSCTYNNTPTSSTLAACPAGTSAYQIVGTEKQLTNVDSGTTSTDTGPLNADEWARFMHDKGIPVTGTTIKPSVTTYTIDVYNAQPNAQHTSLMLGMAKAGGGKYFAAKNEQAIVDALKQILVEIQAVNSSFASTSLPVNATNRSQNENQVFIGMFRPDPNAKPRWFGNLKRYQLIGTSDIDLGDVNGIKAVNTTTGFVTPCATSYWTTDTGSYWNGLSISPDPKSDCNTTTFNAYSDSPDGPQVEKGAAAQMLRQMDMANRNVKTLSGGALAAFSTTTAPSLSADLVKYIRGEDVNNEKNNPLLITASRPSIHGDVIHSRPLPINYGGSTGVTVFYGANDGTYRGVNATTGAERWAFVAPEFFSRLSRLKDNTPLVNYPNLAAGITPTPTPKDYFFDGSTGVYQNVDSSKVWIYPSMRRGGRMIYALDVSAPDSPSYKWSKGCPNLTDDVGCSTGMTMIGQTWSTPSVAFIKGYSTTKPVVIFGGGYDTCEDVNNATTTCSGTTKGGAIYILDAADGTLIQSFTTTRGVAADITLIDIDNDSFPDYAYAADTGGNIYRVDFIASPNAATPLIPANWTSHRVAYTNGSGRKFLFAPAVLAVGTKAYLAIGSGDREHPLQSQYPYENVLYNRIYVVRDDLTSTIATAAINMDSTASPNSMSDFSGSMPCSNPGVLPASTSNGWFKDLRKGEQTVTSALIAAGMVTFSTNQPVVASAGTCASTLGIARGYWLNLLNASGGIGVDGSCGGDDSAEFVGGGLPPSPVMASSVPINGRATTVVIGAIQKTGGASVAISPQKVRPTITSKRRRAYSYTSGD
jgi:Tfp pilus tip-associated adhesin PilY1